MTSTPSSDSSPTRPRSEDLMPSPFAWVQIPAGQVTLKEGDYVQKGGQAFDVKAFEISKYPITNAQYAKFVAAGGYNEPRWWTKKGWEACERGIKWGYKNHKFKGWATPDRWTEPRWWQEPQWNGAEYPVIGISWYECVAFCHWLSERTGEVIRLPQEQEWQRAAQGDQEVGYPWGKTWDGMQCNNSVDKKGMGQTTSVCQYEGKGNSPYGVVDMAGNVWEWCVTGAEDGRHTVETHTYSHVLRGGSWDDFLPMVFLTTFRFKAAPDVRNINYGFRCVRLRE